MNMYGVLYYNEANQTYGGVHGDCEKRAWGVEDGAENVPDCIFY